MAKERLFPQRGSDKQKPHDRFADLASRVLQVPKSEIDEREARWRQDRDEEPSPAKPTRK